MTKDGYYTSGEFAKKANVTLRTIRYYDRQGILKPSKVADNGYRLYTDADFAKLQKILSLKDLGFSLENIAYFELLRRGYRVMIGKIGSTEVDFVAEKQGTYTYFQVTADMTAQETFEREMKPLRRIRDNYEKIVLTGDRLTLGNYDGIQVKYLPDWLLEK